MEYTKEQIKKIEEVFIQRCIHNNVKYKSKKYYEYQQEFFCGAMALLEIPIPKWFISIISNREIVEKYYYEK